MIPFGITNLFHNIRVGDNEESELYASHGMLPYQSKSLWECDNNNNNNHNNNRTTNRIYLMIRRCNMENL